MSLSLPSEAEVPLCKCRVLYLGTSYYNNKNDGNIKINLKLIQETIAKRYPVNGEKYAEGIETWLSIYPSGLQIENSKIDEPDSNGLFFFPIKILVYCGALRLTQSEKLIGTDLNWKFLPLDSEAASDSKNLRNPPIFVSIVRGVDQSFQGESIECHVFVVGMKKSAMKLVESCQKAYNVSNQSVTMFKNKYGKVPLVFKSSEYLNDSVNMKKHDDKGFFYVINNSIIDLWQLYETDNTNSRPESINKKQSTSIGSLDMDSNSLKAAFIDKEMIVNGLIDPYEDAPNLVSVEKTVDPETGQNIYVRWLAEEPIEPRIIETHRENTPSPNPPPLIIRESGRTPEPIIVEKIVQKKKPQLIIKEIHVNEPAPPPIKVVEQILTDSNSDMDAKKVYNKLLQSPYRSHHHHHHQSRHHSDRYLDPFNLLNYPSEIHYSRNRSKNPKYYDNINSHDIYNNIKRNPHVKSYYPTTTDPHFYHDKPKHYYNNPHTSNHVPLYTQTFNVPIKQDPIRQYYNYSNIKYQPKYERPVEHIRTHHEYYANHEKKQYSNIKSERPKAENKQNQEPKKHYRKIIVLEDERNENIEKKTKKNLKAVPQQKSEKYIYAQVPIKMKPKNSYY